MDQQPVFILSSLACLGISFGVLPYLVRCERRWLLDDFLGKWKTSEQNIVYVTHTNPPQPDRLRVTLSSFHPARGGRGAADTGLFERRLTLMRLSNRNGFSCGNGILFTRRSRSNELVWQQFDKTRRVCRESRWSRCLDETVAGASLALLENQTRASRRMGARLATGEACSHAKVANPDAQCDPHFESDAQFVQLGVAGVDPLDMQADVDAAIEVANVAGKAARWLADVDAAIEVANVAGKAARWLAIQKTEVSGSKVYSVSLLR